MATNFKENFVQWNSSQNAYFLRYAHWGFMFFSTLAVTRPWRFVATAFRKKVGLIISTKSNLAVYVLFSLTCKNCHLLTQISPPVCLSPSLFLPLKPPVPVNDRPIISTISRNVFSPKRLFDQVTFARMLQVWFTPIYFTIMFVGI